jgi:RNA polymerase sigma-70 factor (ECF subfamily)
MNYEELHQQYYQRILRYLSTIVGQTDAEDVAQEVFAKASLKLGSLKEQSRVSPWLYKIALNCARDMLRQRSSRGQIYAGPQSASSSSLQPSESQPDPLAQVPDTRGLAPDEHLQYNEMVECYLDFARQLPKRYFEVYALSEFEQLEDTAISKRLQLPLGTVKMRLHRARVKLYETLRGHCRCYTSGRGELMGTLK